MKKANKRYHTICKADEFIELCDTIAIQHSFLKYFVTRDIDSVSVSKGMALEIDMQLIYENSSYRIYRLDRVLSICIKEG